MPLTQALTNALVELLKKLVSGSVTNLHSRNVNSVEIKAEDIRGCSRDDMAGLQTNYHNESYIEAFVHLVGTKSLYTKVSNGKAKPVALAIPDHKVIDIKPVGVVKYSDYTITFSEEDKKESGDSAKPTFRNTRIVIVSSVKPVAEIKKFIETTHRDYMTFLYPPIDPENEAFYYMEQIPSSDRLLFRRYPLVKTTRDKKPFDKIFYPEKTRLVENIARLKSGKLDCLKVLMHGLPGAGKTSTIRAAAFEFGYHIIAVNLKFVKNDSWLQQLFHGDMLSYLSFGNEADGIRFWSCDMKKRMYVIEEIDADTPCVLSREFKLAAQKSQSSMYKKYRRMLIPSSSEDEKPAPPPAVTKGTDDSSDDKPAAKASAKAKPSAKPSAKTTFKDRITEMSSGGELTLKGILNVFDGVLRLVGPLVFITSNHPEHLDPALTRSGRIDMTIEFSRMRGDDVGRLVNTYFDDYPGGVEFPSGTYRPSDVDAACKQTTNWKDAVEMIRQNKW